MALRYGRTKIKSLPLCMVDNYFLIINYTLCNYARTSLMSFPCSRIEFRVQIGNLYYNFRRLWTLWGCRFTFKGHLDYGIKFNYVLCHMFRICKFIQLLYGKFHQRWQIARLSQTWTNLIMKFKNTTLIVFEEYMFYLHIYIFCIHSMKLRIILNNILYI